MREFKVTLVQKVQKMVAAETPSSALDKALQELEKEDNPFFPTSHTIKEIIV